MKKDGVSGDSNGKRKKESESEDKGKGKVRRAEKHIPLTDDATEAANGRHTPGATHHSSHPPGQSNSRPSPAGTAGPAGSEIPKTCHHEVAFPEPIGSSSSASAEAMAASVELPPLPDPPARTYPFTLDPFQETAVRCIEKGQSVLVSAHTSAGKTVVAEYAIAVALRSGQRVIYTSPIKALSNQKFRELTEEFLDVGLMTGDVSIAPNASCLVMTTEILRSMLYRGSEIVREAGWIIFDEVHYMRDKERGVVWEESIIMAPRACRFVFLSATIPNAREFADWVAKVHRQPCHIVYTDYRPTPLQHYIFPAGGAGLFLVVDERGRFREDSFQKAINSLEITEGGPGGGRGGGGGKGGGGRGKGGGGKGGKGGTDGPSDIFRIVKMIMQRQYDPVIVFSFSKADCEALALQMSSLDLNEEKEKEMIDVVFSNAVDSLAEEDRKLPQITSILPLLKRGIGIHHSGLLPILKEVIEILFQEGLLKCLFATETFSIGLNMPAKTVVFTNVRKWDGDRYRWLSGGEYIQMSGRAGRRGLDDKGICVLMLDSKMEPAVAKEMVRGSADPLTSAFRLSYNLILNQVRSPNTEMEKTIRNSFRQFQADRSLPTLQLLIKELEGRRAEIEIENEDKVKEVAELQRQARSYRREIRKIITAPAHILPFLSPGRLVKVLCLKEADGGGEGGRGEEEGGEREGEEGSGAPSAEEVWKEDDPIHRWRPASLLDVVPETWGVVVNFRKLAVAQKEVGEGENGVGGEGGEGGEGGGEKEWRRRTTVASLRDPRAAERFEVDVLTRCVTESPENAPAGMRGLVRPCLPGEAEGEGDGADADGGPVPMVASLPLTQISQISAFRIYLAKDMRPLEAREAAMKAVDQVLQRCAGGTPQMLDPEDDMEVEGKAYRKACRRLEAVEGLLQKHKLGKLPSVQEDLRKLRRKGALKAAIKVAKKEAKSVGDLILKDELKARRRVLRRLGYVDEAGVVGVKGRVACEISSADEVLVTELLFSAALSAETPPEALAALLSCCVWQEKGPGTAQKKLRESLAAPLSQLREVARHVAKVEQECKMPVDEQEYVDSFKPHIMEAVYSWCKGAKFSAVLEMTDGVFEGSLIRAMRRLEELLSQIQLACKAIGEGDLGAKVNAAREQLKRGVVFAASLYL